MSYFRKMSENELKELNEYMLSKKPVDLIEVNAKDPRDLFEQEYFNLRSYNENRCFFGKYVEWVVVSILKTCGRPGEIVVPSGTQNRTEHWDFSYKGIKFDFTLNPNSRPYEGVLILHAESSELFDSKEFFKFNFVLLLYNKYLLFNKIDLDQEKVNRCNQIVNELANQFIRLTNYNPMTLEEKIKAAAKDISHLLSKSNKIEAVIITKNDVKIQQVAL